MKHPESRRINLPKPLSRRRFLGAAAAVAVGAAAFPERLVSLPVRKNGGEPFKLKYAPTLGMFNGHAGKDPIDNIKFIHDQGFRAVFDNGLMNKPAELQEKIAAELSRLGMDLGPFVAYADFKTVSFVNSDPEIRAMLAGIMHKAVETARRTGAKYALVVPGRINERMEWGYQTANVADNLKWLCEICEPSGLTMVIEPLNAWDHPGLFLTKMPQAYQICKAVGSSRCKIVDDVYHQQITEGNLITNIDRCWSEIASFHLGDSPGRKEPTTGEINFRNIFKHIQAKGYDGVLCMEHGRSLKGIEGEKAVIRAYRACDDFLRD